MLNAITPTTGAHYEKLEPHRRVEDTNNRNDSLANDMKQIRKRKLRREVMRDPSLAAKLVATEASPVYNAHGDLIQAVSNKLGEV